MRTIPFAGLLAGFVLWSATFLLLYAVQATGCKLGWDQMAIGPVSLLRLMLSGLLLVTLALLYAIHIRWLRPDAGASEHERQMLLRISNLVHVSAAAATVATFAGIVWLSLC